MKTRHKAGVLAAIAAALLLDQTPADAVPAWMRKTGLECSSCHFGGTSRLTALGRDFQIRGHRLRGDGGIAEAGAQAFRIMEYLTLASRVRYTTSDTEPSNDLNVQAFSVYAGGPLRGKLSFFIQYDLRERSFSARTRRATTTTNRPAEAYLQYNTNPSDASYGWVRAGRIAPYAIYAAGAGGRTTASRPGIINDPIGAGNRYAPRDRAYGVSAGYVHQSGYRAEAGIVNGGGAGAFPNLNRQDDVFVTLEKDLDGYGSGLGVYGYSGSFPIAASPGPPAVPAWQDRFSQFGVLGQWVRDEFEISGAYFTGKNRTPTGGRRDPNGYFLEAAYNLRPDLTGFARYDRKEDDLGPAYRTRGAVFGLSYRLPDRGRAVIEFGDAKQGAARRRQAFFEISWLY